MSKYCKEYIDMHARINERITNTVIDLIKTSGDF